MGLKIDKYTLSVQPSTSNLLEVRNFIAKHTKQHSLPAKTIHEVSLAVDEAFTNVIEHAYNDNLTDNLKSETIGIELQISDSILEVTITDTGTIFEEYIDNPDAVLPKKLDLDKYIKERKSGGLGLHLINKLMSTVSYKRIGNKNILRLTKDFSIK